MSTQEIIPWPEKPMFDELPEMYAYERQRADAAISRLRVAVEALSQYAGIGSDDGPMALVGLVARQALASIGELKGEI